LPVAGQRSCRSACIVSVGIFATDFGANVLPCGNQLYGRSETRHFFTASRMSPHTSSGRLLRSQWTLTVVCETPVSYGRESGKTQTVRSPGYTWIIGIAGASPHLQPKSDLVPGLAWWKCGARVPECILVTFAPYPLSGTISHSHGLRKDRSPFSRRVMDHRGVADRCPISGCCVSAAATRHAVRRNTTSRSV